MYFIPRLPLLLPVAILADQSCEEGWFGVSAAVVGRVGEFVEGEREWNHGYGDEEAALNIKMSEYLGWQRSEHLRVED